MTHFLDTENSKKCTFEAEDGTLKVRALGSVLTVSDARVILRACRRSDLRAIHFDLKRIANVSQEALDTLVAAFLVIERKRMVAVVHCDSVLAARLEPLMLDAPSILLLQDAPQPVSFPESKIPHNVLGAFAKAIVHTVQTMGNIRVTYDESILGAQRVLPPADIGGQVRLEINGPDFVGHLVLGFPLKTFLSLASAVNRKNYEQIEAEIQDWIAEFVNIALGLAKRWLKDEGCTLSYPIPSAFVQSSRSVSSVSPSSWVIPFQSELGGFHVQLESIS